MATPIVTTIDEWLEDVLLMPIREQFNKSTILLLRLDRNEEDVDGKKWKIPAYFSLPQGIKAGAGGKGKTLPIARGDSKGNFTGELVWNWGTAEIYDADIEVSKTSKESFVKALTFNMESLTTAFKLDLDRQLKGTSKGDITTATNAGTSSTSMTVADARYVEVNMSIDCYTGDTKKWTATVSAVDKQLKTVTLAAAQTWAIGDTLYREGNKDEEMQGLAGLIDDGTYVSTLQGYNRTTQPLVKANVTPKLGTTPQDWSLTDMQTIIDDIEVRSGATPTIIYAPHDVVRYYAAQLQSSRQMVNVMKLDGGYTGLAYNNIAVTPLAGIKANSMYFVNEDHIMLCRLADISWRQADGHILDRIGGGGFEAKYEASLFHAAELVCDNFGAQGVLRNIKGA